MTSTLLLIASVRNREWNFFRGGGKGWNISTIEVAGATTGGVEVNPQFFLHLHLFPNSASIYVGMTGATYATYGTQAQPLSGQGLTIGHLGHGFLCGKTIKNNKILCRKNPLFL